MPKNKKKYSALMLMLTLALALWGAAGHPGRAGIVIVCLAIAGLGIYCMSGWAFKNGLGVAEKIARLTLIVVVSGGGASLYGWQFWPSVDTAPATRAHLRVLDVQFGNASSFGVEAIVNVNNMGVEPTEKFAIVRGAIVLAPVFDSAEAESQLFASAPFEHINGNDNQAWAMQPSIVEMNPWYPRDPVKTLHLRYIDKVSDDDQRALTETGAKVWYVITVAGYRDRFGALPVSESCWAYSPKTGSRGKCWGHND